MKRADYNAYKIRVYEKGGRLKQCPEDAAEELFRRPLIKELLDVLDSDTRFEIQRQQQWKAVFIRLKKTGWKLPNRWSLAIDSFMGGVFSTFVWIEHPRLPDVSVQLELNGPYLDSISTMVYKR